MRFLVTFAIGLSLAAMGCSGECETGGDCKSDEVCTDNACVKRVIGPPPVLNDGGVRLDAAGLDAFIISPDAAASDAAPFDGATATDAGPGADAGSYADGGPPFDGGYGIVRVGLIHVWSTATATSAELRAAGSFFEHDEPAIVDTSMSLNATCVLIDRAGPRSRARGLSGTGITIAGFVLSPTSITLRPSTAGVFVPQTDPMFLVQWGPMQDPLRHSILPSAAAGTITSISDTLDSMPDPTPPVITSPVGNSVPLSLGRATLDFAWTPNANTGLVIVAELTDRPRNIVLRCEGTDATGAMSIPLAGRQAFLGKSPVMPLSIELRYEKSKNIVVPLAGSTDTVPTTLRHSTGIRFGATP